MHNFRKAALACLSMLLCFAALSALVIEPAMRSESRLFMDRNVRNELAGQIDLLVVGASHGAHAIMPQVLDEQLGVNSYNLCTANLTMSGRRAMLEKELRRNDVRDVVIELSFNGLTKLQSAGGYEGEAYLLSRLDSPLERLSYVARNVPFADWDLLYSSTMRFAAGYWMELLRGKSGSVIDYADKGYEHGGFADLTRQPLPEMERSSAEFLPGSVDEFRRIIRLARESGARVSVVVVPISRFKIARLEGIVETMQALSRLCAEENVPYVDFNLLKDREAVFPETTAFHDPIHLSDSGAAACSALLAELYPALLSGELPQERFYSDYSELF